MSDKQDMSSNAVIGGKHVETHELQCIGVPVGGVKVQQSINISETEVSTRGFEKHPQSRHNLKMEIHKSGGVAIQSNETVGIGDDLSLMIYVQSGFQMFVETCNATDKEVKGDHSKMLVSQGKTLDADLLTQFNLTQKENMLINEAHFYAFHFIGTNYITIDCEIAVCENDDLMCSFNITRKKRETHRRKRDTSNLEQTTTLSRTFRVVDRPVEKNLDSKTSAGPRGPQYLLVLMIFCTMISVTRGRL
ncbi:hypothetical protein CHS0354_023179 [Potamilus streckersoni]|uniref:ZP domain-containing protein n=1 Tax=Potamilus streckersoni TaxID=2493646 RepID=A0AAE0TB78_9BIVA|nr:hypothetical protein CHS0354_023179 [Potamilus streckersoni]